METNFPELKSKDFRPKLETQIRKETNPGGCCEQFRGCEGDKFLDKVWLGLVF